VKICFKMIEGGSGSDVWTYTLAKQLEKQGVAAEVQVFPHHFQYYPYLLSKASRHSNADIVHTNSWNGFAFSGGNIPHITTEHLVIHDPSLTPYKSVAQTVFHKMVYQFEKASFNSADAITAVGNYPANKVKELFGVEAKPIHNGVDVEAFFPETITEELIPAAKGKIKLLFVGNTTRRKGFDLLPQIMKQLGDKFILLTTTGLRVKGVSETNNIVSIGKLNHQQLQKFYNYCDIFLFPSRMEGFGLTACEAMACGKPVVTTNVSSLPEIVMDGQCGYLCEKDNIQQFVDSIIALADSPSTRESIGAFNIDRVGKYFTLERMANDYIESYQYLLKHWN
jgi:glycosyltransferase involved in cell wall biosynthesis